MNDFQKQRKMLFSQITGKEDRDLVPFILQGLDDEGLKIYNAFDLTAEQRKDPGYIFLKFEERLQIAKPNFRAARLDLHFYYQEKEETLDDFYTRCKKKTAECNFSSKEEKERIIEQLLASTPIDDFRRWILGQNDEVTMESVLEEGRKLETTLNSVKYISSHNTNNQTDNCVDAIAQQEQKLSKTSCKRCGRDHKGNPDCPARDSVCHYCQKKGHWASVCFKKKQQYNTEAKPKHKQTKHCCDCTNRKGSSKGFHMKLNVTVMGLMIARSPQLSITLSTSKSKMSNTLKSREKKPLQNSTSNSLKLTTV